MKKRIERIGTSDYITVKSHARELYLPLRADITRVFGIKKGDVLKVNIEGRAVEGGESGEEEE